MELKKYQERVMDEVRAFLEALASQRAQDDSHASAGCLAGLSDSAGTPSAPHRERQGSADFLRQSADRGGQTLLATQILGQTYKTLLKARNGAGLVLWVVPSDQIYKDTLKALRDRRHFYRESLEYALSRRLEIWEKQDVARLTPAQLHD